MIVKPTSKQIVKNIGIILVGVLMMLSTVAVTAHRQDDRNSISKNDAYSFPLEQEQQTIPAPQKRGAILSEGFENYPPGIEPGISPD